MELKSGSYYLSREREVVGPMERNYQSFKAGGRNYKADGSWIGYLHKYDLIKEVDSKGNPLAHETLKAPSAVWGEWKIWNGGKCPTDESTLVQAQQRDVTRVFAELCPGYYAKCFTWEHEGRRKDIIAYRVKAIPIITKKEVLVASGGYNRYISLEVVDGVVPDLLIKGSDW